MCFQAGVLGWGGSPDSLHAGSAQVIWHQLPCAGIWVSAWTLKCGFVNWSVEKAPEREGTERRRRRASGRLSTAPCSPSPAAEWKAGQGWQTAPGTSFTWPSLGNGSLPSDGRVLPSIRWGEREANQRRQKKMAGARDKWALFFLSWDGHPFNLVLNRLAYDIEHWG